MWSTLSALQPAGPPAASAEKGAVLNPTQNHTHCEIRLTLALCLVSALRPLTLSRKIPSRKCLSGRFAASFSSEHEPSVPVSWGQTWSASSALCVRTAGGKEEVYVPGGDCRGGPSPEPRTPERGRTPEGDSSLCAPAATAQHQPHTQEQLTAPSLQHTLPSPVSWF